MTPGPDDARLMSLSKEMAAQMYKVGSKRYDPVREIELYKVSFLD